MTGHGCNNFVLIKVFSYGARVSSFTFYVTLGYITPATFIANNKVYSRLYVFVKVLRHGRHEFLFLFLTDKFDLTFFPASPARHLQVFLHGCDFRSANWSIVNLIILPERKLPLHLVKELHYFFFFFSFGILIIIVKEQLF